MEKIEADLKKEYKNFGWKRVISNERVWHRILRSKKMEKIAKPPDEKGHRPPFDPLGIGFRYALYSKKNTLIAGIGNINT